MESVEIRPFTPDDYAAIAEVHNAIYPETPTTVDACIEGDMGRNPQCRHQRWVGVQDGRVVGVGSYDQSLWHYDPRRFRIVVEVLPDYQRRKIGSALYEQIVAGVQRFNPATLYSQAREDHPQGIRFLERRGFTETEREGMLQLDVRTFDPTPYASLEDELCAQGIAIKTLIELESDPDRNRKLYEMDLEIIPDLPDELGLTPPPFEEWVGAVITAPHVIPDAYFIATHGDEYVGASELWKSSAPGSLHQGLTCVKRAWRRRGIALALKARAIAYARAHGVARIQTGNDMNNRPILALNERLGFVRQPDWITFTKDCCGDWRLG